MIRDHAQVGLHTVLQDHTGFRFSFCQDPFDQTRSDEMLGDPSRFFGRDQQIKISNCLFGPAQAASCTDL